MERGPCFISPVPLHRPGHREIETWRPTSPCRIPPSATRKHHAYSTSARRPRHPLPLPLPPPLLASAAGGARLLAAASLMVAALSVGDVRAAPPPAPPVQALNERGAKLFENTCAACHAGGGNVIGFARNKTLKSKALERYGYDSKEAIVELLRHGKGVMPPYGADRLSDEDAEDVSEFVLQAAERNWQ